MLERAVWLLAIGVGVFFSLAALRPYMSSPPEDDAPPLPLPSPPHPFVDGSSIRIAVLNGCGASQVAGRLTKRVRNLGFDVIYEGNAENFNFLHTIVVDRVGAGEKALRVAEALGVKHCVQQATQDSFRLEEVSIIIGKDYKRIKLLEE